MSKQSDSQLSPPVLSEGSDRDLRSESTLGELPLYVFQVDIKCESIAITRIFEKYPLLPGVILLEEGKFAGMLSRLRLLEYLIRPRAIEMFLHEALEILYSYARTEILMLSEQTPIVDASRVALRRSPELLGEPIVVKMEESSEYRLLNVQELNIAYWQIRGIETQLRFEHMQADTIQSEKMASLGRLVDGVAHEILDPVGFIWGNLNYVADYSQNLVELMAAYEKYLPELPEEIVQLRADMELDYLQQDLPRAMASIRNGADRLKKLVSSLQNFCHIDEVYPKPADLHACIDSALLLIKSRLSGEIEVVRNYGHLPPVSCYAGQLNQVFMNIFTMAIDGLLNKAVNQKFAQEFREIGLDASPVEITSKSRIEITTQLTSQPASLPAAPDSRWVTIKIADNGPGMSPEKLQKLLASFSTEKRQEKETSLVVSYWIVTAKHGGQFHVRSQPGEGTEFEILLPLV